MFTTIRRGLRAASFTCALLPLLTIAELGRPVDLHGQNNRGARAAQSARMRILVSVQKRRLWLLQGRDTVLTAEVAVGRNETLILASKRYRFSTPRGVRRVLRKERDPLWTPPDWHYLEKAQALGLKYVRVRPGGRHRLADGTRIEVRGDQVGRVNHFGNFWPFTPGIEIVFDQTLFIPPMGTAQRKIPNALGRFKLDLGDGYLIHGTHLYNEDSLGQAASHGCVRMADEDLALLFDRVPIGTTVHIF